jgi:hypothetical protein
MTTHLRAGWRDMMRQAIVRLTGGVIEIGPLGIWMFDDGLCVTWRRRQRLWIARRAILPNPDPKEP